MFFASILGQIGHPFYVVFAQILAFCYELVPNFAIAIALLTLIVMLVVFPITLRGTRGMMKMQLLAPELKKLQAKYKVQPGMSVAERQDLRQRQQEEMMAVYRENNVSPMGGCLPMLLQFPIFLILYGTIRGLIHQTTVGTGKAAHLVADPLYISHNSAIYKAIAHAHGQLVSFGINLGDSVRTSGLSWAQKVPFILMILIAIALQYVQIKQLSGRNPAAAAANPQMQQMQKIMPLIFAVIYISIPAAVNVYFIVSNIFRIAQQEIMYRRDPHIQASLAKLQARHRADAKIVEAKGKPVTKGPVSGAKGLLKKAPPAAETNSGGSTNGTAPTKPSAGKPNGAQPTPPKNPRPRPSAGRANAPKPPTSSQPRAKGKRPRKPR